MTPEDAAEATAEGVGALSSHFMLDGATYAKGAELGFDGMDFYVGGRGGVLGDVDADVVAAALVFFEPGTIRQRWEGAGPVMSRAEAGAAFARCGHEWAVANLGDDVDWARLADLAGQVVAGASPAGAPVFAGWRRLDVPADPKARALHQMNGLRELRMAMHGAAVLSSGIAPLDALMVRTPYMAGLFGWDEPHPDPEPSRAAWQQAEAGTNRGFGRHLAGLDEAGRKDLVRLVTDAHAATS
jgi:hypothetical protein